MLTGNDILAGVRKVLNDEHHVRWSDTDLVRYLNMAMRQVAVVRPDASAVTESVQLVDGTRQSLPAGGLRLLDVIRNMGADGATPGMPVTVCDRHILDGSNLYWHVDAGGGGGLTGGTIDSVTLTDTAVDASNSAQYTFTGVSVGAAAANRHLVVAVHSYGDAGTEGVPPDTLTVNGTSAQKISEASGNFTGSSGVAVALFLISFPSGATADLVATFPSVQHEAEVAVYSVLGESVTSTASCSDGHVSSFSLSCDLDVLDGGAIIAAAANFSGLLRSPTWAWTGVTQQYETDSEKQYSGASDLFPTGGNQTVSVSYNPQTMESEKVALCVAALTASSCVPGDGIENYAFDAASPKTFYVTPPASCGSQVEIVYSKAPDEFTTENLGESFRLDDIYHGPVHDFMLHLGFSLEISSPASQALARSYEQSFYQALGLKTRADLSLSPNTRETDELK